MPNLIIKYIIIVVKKWGYKLIITNLEEKQPLIIGFNSGVDNSWEEYKSGKEYKHQATIEKENFTKIYKGSLQRAMNMCSEYFPHISFEKGSHSNFCFFRSEKENQITKNDIELCKPIFKKMISIINPSIIFCFSAQARQYLIESGFLDNYQEESFGNSRRCISAKAELNGIKIFFLPHPNSRVKKELRRKAWEYCSKTV